MMNAASAISIGIAGKTFYFIKKSYFAIPEIPGYVIIGRFYVSIAAVRRLMRGGERGIYNRRSLIHKYNKIEYDYDEHRKSRFFRQSAPQNAGCPAAVGAYA
jgi:hypothetical protein